jgi:hypothetical protein
LPVLCLVASLPAGAESPPVTPSRQLSELAVRQDGSAVVFELRDPAIAEVEVEIFAAGSGRALFRSGRRAAGPVRWAEPSSAGPLRFQLRAWDRQGRLVTHHVSTRSLAELIAALPFESVPAGTDAVTGGSDILLDAPVQVSGDLAASGNLRGRNAVKAYGYVRFDGVFQYGYGVASATWNPTLTRYEIDLSEGCYGIDEATVLTIRGDAGSCPAGAVVRTGSVSCHLLVYIIEADGDHRQCSFNFVTFYGQG